MVQKVFLSGEHFFENTISQKSFDDYFPSESNTLRLFIKYIG